MIRILQLSAIAMILCLSSCNKNNDNPNVTFVATLTGSNEVPSNGTTGTGTATLIFNNDTKIFTLSVNYSGLTGAATSSHIHVGAAGTAPAGNIIFPLTVSVSPIVYTSLAITTAQENDLRAGLWYVNIHTALYPGGEIRGQLIQQ